MITTGSVQAPETLYWGIAATLAKHGYVVLTYDTQGQGRSDTFGEGADQPGRRPLAGGPPVLRRHRGRARLPALDPGAPLRPAPELHRRGTDHSPKQDRRVADGPERRLQPARATWSTRAGSGSPATRSAPARSPTSARSTIASTRSPPGTTCARPSRRRRPACAVGLRPRAPADPPITKPALGISNDYGLTPTPNTSDPDPEGANAGFPAYKDAGVDSMEFYIRGGTHYESSFIPGMTDRRARHSRPCAAPTWSPGTRPPGSTSTSSARATPPARRRPTGACSPTAGATTRAAARSTPTATRTSTRSTCRSRYDLRDARRRRGHLRRHARRLRLDGPGRAAGRLRPRRRRLHGADRARRRRRRAAQAVRAAAAGHRRQGHAGDPGPERRRRRDPRPRRRRPAARAATATTASTATPATTGCSATPAPTSSRAAPTTTGSPAARAATCSAAARAPTASTPRAAGATGSGAARAATACAPTQGQARPRLRGVVG